MQIVKLMVFVTLGEIKFATDERCRVGWYRQTFLHFLGGKRWELRQKCETAFANRLAHLTVPDIREKNKWCGSAEFLTLKKQRRPRTEQKQRSHRAITAGRAL